MTNTEIQELIAGRQLEVVERVAKTNDPRITQIYNDWMQTKESAPE